MESVNDPKHLSEALEKFGKTDGRVKRPVEVVSEKTEVDYNERLISLLEKSNRKLESIDKNIKLISWLVAIPFLLSVLGLIGYLFYKVM